MTSSLLARAKASLKSRLFAKTNGSRARNYQAVCLTPEEIAAASYKRFLGGGADAWQTRGLFQLQLLKDRGLSPTCSCLDLGCGPLRAGMHIIAYLNKGGYLGIDFNESFIDAARYVIEEQGLTGKEPVVLLSQDFSIPGLDRKFDYAIAFSVLNHYDQRSKQIFFDRVPSYLGDGGRIIISHAGWLEEGMVRDAGLKVLDVIGPEHYDLALYGWAGDEARNVFPIVEVAKPEGRWG